MNSDHAERLLKVIANWEGTDDLFAEIVASYLDASGKTNRELADVFEAAPSTITRWANGVSRPRQRTKQYVVQWIKEQVEKEAKP